MRREDRRVVALLGFLHGMVHGNILSIPVFLSLAWRSAFQADQITLGFLAAIGFGCFGLGSVPFGYLADRRPPQTLLLVCTAGIAASLAAVAVSPTIPVLAVSLGALGLFSGIYHPTGLSVISRSVKEPGRGMGWHGMGGSLGIALVPAFVAGAFALGWAWQAVESVLILVPVVGLGLAIARPVPTAAPDPIPSARPDVRSLVTRTYVLVLLVYMFAGVAYQGGLTFLPQFIGAGPFALALGLGAVGQVLSGTLADRARPDRLLFGLSGTAAALLVLLAMLSPSTAFTFVALGFGFLLFSLEPLQNTLVTRSVARPLQGLGFGFTFLAVFGLGSSGAALAGYLISRGETAIMFALFAGSLATSGIVGLVAGRAGAH